VLSVTCLNDLQVAVLLGMDVVGDVQARAVVVVQRLPDPPQPRFGASFLFSMFVLQPSVSAQELCRKGLLKPAGKAYGHGKPVGAVGGRRALATRLVVGSEMEPG
jgi:hypothetical protein